MDDERDEWEAEKKSLEEEVERLKKDARECISQLDEERSKMNANMKVLEEEVAGLKSELEKNGSVMENERITLDSKLINVNSYFETVKGR